MVRLSRSFVVSLPLAALIVACSLVLAADDQDTRDPPADSANPYMAREGLSPEKLLDFIDRMKAKPKTIRSRPGFSLAVLDAADRIMASNTDASLKTAALLEKLTQLHYQACLGDLAADEELRVLADALPDDKRPKVAEEVQFLLLEQRVLAADDLARDELPALLDEIRAYLAAHPPEARHLRMASATVRVINRMPGDEAADKAYHEFGAMFSKSEDRELSKYGRKIEKGSKPASLVGKPLELAGTLVDGTPLDWDAYRGKVVLVDFWATWCGPCRAEIPNVKENYAAYHDRGFEVVGISLDNDREALVEFMRDEQIPWPNVFSEGDGGGWKNPLAVKYNIHAIPATFLVDRTGKVVAENVRGPELAKQLEQLLADGGASNDKPDPPGR